MNLFLQFIDHSSDPPKKENSQFSAEKDTTVAVVKFTLVLKVSRRELHYFAETAMPFRRIENKASRVMHDHYSSVVDISSEKYIISTSPTGIPGTSKTSTT